MAGVFRPSTIFANLAAPKKEIYATGFCAGLEHEAIFADFSKEGAYAKWNQEEERRYGIFRFVIEGNTLVMDYGNVKKAEAVMALEKIKRDNSGGGLFGFREGHFLTPEGWLLKYLSKHEPGSIFAKSDDSSVKLIKVEK